MQNSPKSRHRVHRVAVVSPVENSAKAQTPATVLSVGSIRGSTASGSKSPWRRSTAETQQMSPLPSPFSGPDWTTVYKATGLTPTFFAGSLSRVTTPSPGHAQAQRAIAPHRGQGEVREKEDEDWKRMPSNRSMSCPPGLEPGANGRFLGEGDGTRTNSRGSRVQWRDELTTDLGAKSTLSSPTGYRSVAEFTRSVKGVSFCPSNTLFLTVRCV